MPPTERTILTSFLLAPASLPTIISFSIFASYFPSSERTSCASEIRRLYRALQQRRALLTDAVATNVEREVKNGAAQRRAIMRVKQAEKTEVEDEEVLIERVLFGPTSNLPIAQQHTLETIIPELEVAAADVDAEVQEMEREVEELLGHIKATVSELSDLRYGRLGNGKLNDEVLESLSGLSGVCEKK